jgi:hypothetical protein
MRKRTEEAASPTNQLYVAFLTVHMQRAGLLH